MEIEPLIYTIQIAQQVIIQSKKVDFIKLFYFIGLG